MDSAASHRSFQTSCQRPSGVCSIPDLPIPATPFFRVRGTAEDPSAPAQTVRRFPRQSTPAIPSPCAVAAPSAPRPAYPLALWRHRAAALQRQPAHPLTACTAIALVPLPLKSPARCSAARSTQRNPSNLHLVHGNKRGRPSLSEKRAHANSSPPQPSAGLIAQTNFHIKTYPPNHGDNQETARYTHLHDMLSTTSHRERLPIGLRDLRLCSI